MEPTLILVVEDDPGLQHMLEFLLRRAGFEVRLADNGAAALEMLKTIRPRLIVTDLMMPQMGGVSLIQQLKRQKEFTGVPVIALSGYSQSLAAAARAAGAEAVLRKPEDIPTLVATITRLLGRPAA